MPPAPGGRTSPRVDEPRTGTDINVVYGYGTAYAYYRNNTDVFLDGYWGNYSGSSPLTVDGTFNY